MISPLIKWDHSVAWPVMEGTKANAGSGGRPCSCTFVIDPYNQESKDLYLLDHVVDGRILFPFTGHIVLAWKALCKLRGLDVNKTPVIMEDIKVHRATILTHAVKFDVTISFGTGEFEILEGDSLAANGKIHIVEDDRPFFYERIGLSSSNLSYKRHN